MAILSIASAKGGCGKSTTAILLGAELALGGYKVAILDCDPNQHVTAFAAKKGTKEGIPGRTVIKAEIPGLTVIGDVLEGNVLSELKKAETDNDVVILDLPGGSSTLALKALQRSHFVLVPTQASLPDARDAMKTIAQIDDAQDLARLPIERALLWTRFLPGFESKAARHVRESLEGQGVTILKTIVMERAAYREIHITGQVPRQLDPANSPSANISALAEEILDKLQKMAGVEAA